MSFVSVYLHTWSRYSFKFLDGVNLVNCIISRATLIVPEDRLQQTCSSGCNLYQKGFCNFLFKFGNEYFHHSVLSTLLHFSIW